MLAEEQGQDESRRRDILSPIELDHHKIFDKCSATKRSRPANYSTFPPRIARQSHLSRQKTSRVGVIQVIAYSFSI